VKKLNLQDFESIAEIIGAIAIVVSLIYVGIQVNDSTRAVRSATANDTSAAMSQWYITVGSNAEATRILLDGMTNPEVLNREETAQFVYMFHGLFLEYQAAYYVAEQGTLDVEMRDFLVNTLAGVREQPGFLKYWNQRREIFNPSFRAFVDDLIAQGTTNKSLEQIYRPRDSQ
jgi:hypothetical protein